MSKPTDVTTTPMSSIISSLLFDTADMPESSVDYTNNSLKKSVGSPHKTSLALNEPIPDAAVNSTATDISEHHLEPLSSSSKTTKTVSVKMHNNGKGVTESSDCEPHYSLSDISDNKISSTSTNFEAQTTHDYPLITTLASPYCTCYETFNIPPKLNNDNDDITDIQHNQMSETSSLKHTLDGTNLTFKLQSGGNNNHDQNCETNSPNQTGEVIDLTSSMVQSPQLNILQPTTCQDQNSALTNSVNRVSNEYDSSSHNQISNTTDSNSQLNQTSNKISNSSPPQLNIIVPMTYEQELDKYEQQALDTSDVPVMSLSITSLDSSIDNEIRSTPVDSQSSRSDNVTSLSTPEIFIEDSEVGNKRRFDFDETESLCKTYNKRMKIDTDKETGAIADDTNRKRTKDNMKEKESIDNSNANKNDHLNMDTNHVIRNTDQVITVDQSYVGYNDTMTANSKASILPKSVDNNFQTISATLCSSSSDRKHPDESRNSPPQYVYKHNIHNFIPQPKRNYRPKINDPLLDSIPMTNSLLLNMTRTLLHRSFVDNFEQTKNYEQCKNFTKNTAYENRTDSIMNSGEKQKYVDLKNSPSYMEFDMNSGYNRVTRQKGQNLGSTKNIHSDNGNKTSDNVREVNNTDAGNSFHHPYIIDNDDHLTHQNSCNNNHANKHSWQNNNTNNYENNRNSNVNDCPIPSDKTTNCNALYTDIHPESHQRRSVYFNENGIIIDHSMICDGSVQGSEVRRESLERQTERPSVDPAQLYQRDVTERKTQSKKPSPMPEFRTLPTYIYPYLLPSNQDDKENKSTKPKRRKKYVKKCTSNLTKNPPRFPSASVSRSIYYMKQDTTNCDIPHPSHKSRSLSSKQNPLGLNSMATIPSLPSSSSAFSSPNKNTTHSINNDVNTTSVQKSLNKNATSQNTPIPSFPIDYAHQSQSSNSPPHSLTSSISHSNNKDHLNSTTMSNSAVSLTKIQEKFPYFYTTNINDNNSTSDTLSIGAVNKSTNGKFSDANMPNIVNSECHSISTSSSSKSALVENIPNTVNSHYHEISNSIPTSTSSNSPHDASMPESQPSSLPSRTKNTSPMSDDCVAHIQRGDIEALTVQCAQLSSCELTSVCEDPIIHDSIATILKESDMISANYTESSPEEEREHHNQKERIRRARIRDATQLMRQLVPGITEKTDKATVVEFAARYIYFLIGFVGRNHDKEFLLKYNPY